jgi:hypothetical protein
VPSPLRERRKNSSRNTLVVCTRTLTKEGNVIRLKYIKKLQVFVFAIIDSRVCFMLLGQTNISSMRSSLQVKKRCFHLAGSERLGLFVPVAV